ncbi:MAG TPA: glycosyltransferase [Elusimicrobiota bacterium]|nr:glycosyltransferase [Elusimicrobiota bacterium]
MSAAHWLWRAAGDSLNVLAYSTGIFSLAFAVFSAIASVFFLRRLKRSAAAKSSGDFTPSVAILKPIKGLDRRLYENLASFFRQNYPGYRIYFTLGNEADPARPVIERVCRDFPDIPSEIIVSKKSPGCNPKINSLAGAEDRLEADMIIMADSDIRVAPDFIRRCVAPFRDPDVGLASCFYRIAAPSNPWERLEALSVNCQFLPQALAAASFGMTFAMGAAIAVRAEAFRKIGGFKSLSNHLAEDFLLGRLIEGAGYTVAFSSSAIESVPHLARFSDYLRHQERWARTIRLCQPSGYLGTFLLQGVSLLTLKIALLGASLPATALAGAVLLAKAAGTSMLSVAAFDSPPSLKTLFLLPLGEWMGFYAWFQGWKSTPVVWRGNSYEIGTHGRLLPSADDSLGASRGIAAVKL